MNPLQISATQDGGEGRRGNAQKPAEENKVERESSWATRFESGQKKLKINIFNSLGRTGWWGKSHLALAFLKENA
jgi:hypothetical protein